MELRKVLLAGWIAGLVVGLSQAWWWSNVYIAMGVLLGGIVLTVTARVAVDALSETRRRPR
jgi:asparagine N-glycosylation enzyme membrane subunit Stt3